MDLYGKIVKYVIHPMVMIKRKKSVLFKYLNEFEKSQYNSLNEIKEKQWDMLKKLIDHAYENSPFYKTRFQKAGLKPSDIQNLSDYLKVPVLTKRDIKDHLKDLTALNYPMSDLVPNKTGGSTGTPMEFYHDRLRVISIEASGIRNDRWAGYDIGDKLAVIWGSARDNAGQNNINRMIKNVLLNRHKLLDSSSITKENLHLFVKELRKFKPKTILAYAQSIYLFANYCRANSINDINPSSIITSAEVLLEDQRIVIENVFGCKVFNRYGCRELGGIASECSEHKGLHICSDSLYVEFLDKSGKPVKPGERGDVIITDLRNYGMPFMRYKIGDVGTPSDNICKCNRGLPLMEMVGGRITDFIVTPQGKYVSGVALALPLIASVPGIRQIQIIQDRLNHILYKIVPVADFNEKYQQILNAKTIEFFGKEMLYDVNIVDSIPSEPSGKSRVSISNVNQY